MTALYICYQSVLEPLTRTQVLPYVEGLVRAGYEMHLLTFEPSPLDAAQRASVNADMQSLGIKWHTLRYHKRPSVPATAYDIAAGIRLGRRLIRRHGVRLVHARSHVPAVMARALARLTGVKFIFDIRGLLAEEYVAAGVWKEDGRLYRLTKSVERGLMQAADAYVVLTNRAADMLRRVYADEMRGKPLQVIPCCVDLRRFHLERGVSAEGGAGPIVYAGKLGGIYPAREMARFVESAARRIPGLKWQIWTQTPADRAREELGTFAADASIGRVVPEKLAAALSSSRAALAFYRPGAANIACSPTKIAEYLAAGLPVVCGRGVGDVDEVLQDTRGAVGVLVDDFSPESYDRAALQLQNLLTDETLGDRCRAVARDRFDLESVGWRRYGELYRLLIGAAA